MHALSPQARTLAERLQEPAQRVDQFLRVLVLRLPVFALPPAADIAQVHTFIEQAVGRDSPAAVPEGIEAVRELAAHLATTVPCPEGVTGAWALQERLGCYEALLDVVSHHPDLLETSHALTETAKELRSFLGALHELTHHPLT